MNTDARVDALRLRVFRFPSRVEGEPHPEADGTATWDSTSVLVVELDGGGRTGLGYSYTTSGAFDIARDLLAPLILASDPFATSSTWRAMVGSVRNAGWPGVAATAVSAVDIALHDLAAKLLDVSLLRFLGADDDRVMAYGSGGFTNLTDGQLERQLGGWAEQGYRAVKLKVGTDPGDDPRRVALARAAVGHDVQVFVDANGAYDRKQALDLGTRFADEGVTWFEEPVSSDDLAGLRLVRDRGPSGMQIAAGEYGYTPTYFGTMLNAGAVDTLQADATRCGGVTGFRSAALQAQASHTPLSAHTAPALHATLGAALPGVVHVEAFHDHLVIERVIFDGLPALHDGALVPDATAPGHGLALRLPDALPYRTAEWTITDEERP